MNLTEHGNNLFGPHGPHSNGRHYAAGTLTGLFLVAGALTLIGLIGIAELMWWPVKALGRRVRTYRWEPAVGDPVFCRSMKAYGLIESIYGRTIRVEFYLGDDVTPCWLDTTRRDLLLEARAPVISWH